MPLVPLLIEMVGLPIPATCWIYQYLYPINRGIDGLLGPPKTTDPMIQHLFLLGLAAWLLTVGPRENLFDLDQYVPKPNMDDKKEKKE